MSDFVPNGVSLSGTITLGGTSQALAADNPGRRGLFIQNISAGDLWVNPFGAAAAVDTIGSFKIPTMTSFNIPTNDAVAIIGATTAQKFSAVEY